MTAIKTMILTMVVLLISSHSMAFLDISTRKLYEGVRPGDGKEKNNPRHRHGESIKGYFYRIYGDTVPVVDAKDVAFKGPFKRKKTKRFLKGCQKRKDAEITSSKPEILKREIYAIFSPKEFHNDVVATIQQIVLKLNFTCTYTTDFNQRSSYDYESVAVYLDRDEKDSMSRGLYVDYDHCDSDDRAHLSTGEYSIHYDDNLKCHADLKEVSD